MTTLQSIFTLVTLLGTIALIVSVGTTTFAAICGEGPVMRRQRQGRARP